SGRRTAENLADRGSEKCRSADVRVALAHAHLEAAVRAQRRHLANPHRAPGKALEPQPLEQHGGDELHLGLPEALADADPRAAAEGDVGAARERRLALAREALGDELLGLREDLGEAVARPRAVVHVRAGGAGVAGEL